MTVHNRHALETMIKSLETEREQFVATFNTQIEQLRNMLGVGETTRALPPAESSVIDLEHQENESGTPVFAPAPASSTKRTYNTTKKKKKGSRTMSPEARARIGEAQRRRWASAKA